MEEKTLLRKAREERGETITGMANKLGIGVSRYFYIENGERPATPELAKEISMILNVNEEDIFLPQSFTVRKIGAYENNPNLTSLSTGTLG